MGARNGLGPNAPVPSGSTRESAQGEWVDEGAAAEAEADRTLNQTDAGALDETMTLQEADARREVPRLRDDNVRPRKMRKFQDGDHERPMLSSNMKKDYSRTKRAWESSLPKTRRRALDNTMRDADSLEGLNRAMRGTHGTKSELPPAVRKRGEAVDRAIQDFERTNERQHIVYTTLRAPKDHGNSRNAVLSRLQGMADDPESQPLTFDGYVPATHSLGNITNDKDIVLEMRTKSGAYLGDSDTTPNSDHIVNRGRSFKIVGFHEVSYVKPDGSRGTRPIVQVDDVTDDGRTAASQ